MTTNDDDDDEEEVREEDDREAYEYVFLCSWNMWEALLRRKSAVILDL